MITLDITDPHWIKNDGDDPEDQCAHGYITFSVNDLEVVNPDTEWTISAAGLFLLRTISADNTEEEPVCDGNYLIPCCGFNIWPDASKKYPVFVPGCVTGINPRITHIGDDIEISLDGKSTRVSKKDWGEAIIGFADKVQDFYDDCEPKVRIDDKHDREGWKRFWKEWNIRLSAARNGEKISKSKMKTQFWNLWWK